MADRSPWHLFRCRARGIYSVAADKSTKPHEIRRGCALPPGAGSVGGKPPFPDKLVLQHLDILRKEKDALVKHNDSVVPAEPVWAHDFSRPPPVEMADDPAAVAGIGTQIAMCVCWTCGMCHALNFT